MVRLISVGKLRSTTHMSFGVIDGRAFNQEVPRRFLILGGSVYLSTSPEDMSVSSMDSNVSDVRKGYADKFGNRKFLSGWFGGAC